MALQHGVNIREQPISPPSVRTVDASTIFVIGTAPDADVTGKFGNGVEVNGVKTGGTAMAYNEPFLLTRRSDAPTNDLGEGGTLKRALDSIFAQGNFKVIMTIIEQSGDLTAAAEVTFETAQFNSTTDQTVLDGLSGSDEIFAVIHDDGKRYLAWHAIKTADETSLTALEVGRTIDIFASGASITPLQSYTVMGAYDTTKDRIEINADASTAGLVSGTNYEPKARAQTAVNGEVATLANAIGDASEHTGVYSALSAESLHGTKPRLLCAPGLDTGSRPGGSANGLATALVTVADRLRTFAFIDGPNTSHAAVIEYIKDFDTSRAIVIDPAAKIATDLGPQDFAMSGFAAGVAARTDYEIGWWASFSNKRVNNIIGLGRPIDSGDPNSRAQIMLDNGIWTVVNDAGGFQLWGTESPTTSDEIHRFPSVRRTADILADSLEASHRWAVAKGITKNYFSAVVEGMNAFIRELVAKGALSGGLCYADDDLNTEATIEKGEAHFNLEFTPVYPANYVVILMQLTTKYVPRPGS